MILLTVPGSITARKLRWQEFEALGQKTSVTRIKEHKLLAPFLPYTAQDPNQGTSPCTVSIMSSHFSEQDQDNPYSLFGGSSPRRSQSLSS